jgi:hypothetical protein
VPSFNIDFGDKRASTERWLGRNAPRLAAAAAFAGAVVLIVVQLKGEKGSPDSTTLGLFLIATALGFILLAPAATLKALQRVTRFKVGSVELGLAEIKRAERVRPPQEGDGVRAEPRPRGKGYEDCANRLRNRLNRVRRLLKLKARKDDFAAIAEELRRADLLNRDEETFVVDLQEHDPLSADWSSATEQKFLDDTWAFATRFRALIWDRYVRKQLRDNGWFIVDFPQKPGHRPDFLACRDEKWALVAARVGSLREGKPDNLDVVAKRLGRFHEGPALSVRSIIVPDKARVEMSADLPAQVRTDVRLLTLEESAAAPAPEPV